jgi:flavin-dependent dehydrogenase
MNKYTADILIIGAGPSGALAAALLCREGYSVSIFERERFPRFSIGESLLPQSMAFLEKAGVLPAIEKSGFQMKNGAAFQWGDQQSIINFSEKYSPGWSQTFEVQRAPFDALLADHATKCGAKIYYQHTIQSYQENGEWAQLSGQDADGQPYTAQGRFVLDGSGYGRTLSRLLGLEKPSTFPPRKAIFTHIRDHIAHPSFDRTKILITVHHKNPNIWYWLIPFSDGTSSIGVVGAISEINCFGDTDEQRLKTLIQEDQYYKMIMPAFELIRPVGSLEGYACGVTRLYGKKYALLGNAGEFLDPVFSSGVTIALKSADLAANLLCRQFKGETVDWETEYALSLMVGVNAFRAFVEAWYEGSLQKIIFNLPEETNTIKQMIISLLAGYAWDDSNRFVKEGKRLLSAIAKGID